MQRIVSRWGEHGTRPEPLDANRDAFGAWTLTQEVTIRCNAKDAWNLITDVTRIGEFSPECMKAEWIEGDHAAVGALFEGTNRVAFESEGEQVEVIWTRPCRITRAEQGARFSYTVGDRFDGSPASEWDFVVEEVGDDKCQVTQTFRHVADGLSGIRIEADASAERAEQIIANRSAGLSSGMRDTLNAMKRILESDLS